MSFMQFIALVVEVELQILCTFPECVLLWNVVLTDTRTKPSLCSDQNWMMFLIFVLWWVIFLQLDLWLTTQTWKMAS